MYTHERELAIQAVLEACTLGRRVQDQIAAAGAALTKEDRSPVTVADLAIQGLISRRLAATYPEDPLLAEEDASSLAASAEVASRVLELCRTRLPELRSEELAAALDRGQHQGHSRRYWVLDPVDGTKGFLRGDQYAIALALVEEGEVVVGVLGCPNLELVPGGLRGTVFAAVRDQGTTMRGLGESAERTIRVDPTTEPSGAVFCESVEAAHAAHSIHAKIAKTLGAGARPYRIDSQCKYGIVARGEASIYLRLPRDSSYREKVWDHAAGSLVVSEAGGRVSDLDGQPLDFSEGRLLGNGRGIIVTNGPFHDRVLEAARAARADA